jgi:hypothetical protein
MRYGPPFRYAYREDGRRVAYQVVGEGDLDLVFLFGWPNLSAASPAETYEGIRSLGPVDIRGLLGSVQAPVLVLHRTGDRVADIVDSTRLAADMGDRRWHRVLVEHQEVVRQQLVGLLGDDIGGIAVHIAARVMAAAGAGEIVCSRTVKDLVAGAGYAFADRGTRTLKGVPDSWQLYAVELAER